MTQYIRKMSTSLKDVVEYTLEINDTSHVMNNYIRKHISISWKGSVICQSCQKLMKKFYRSNFCYKCFWESPLASQSIFKPELCTAHLNIKDRDLEWEKKFQIAPHFIYLANSSGLKVGITRGSQGVIRWMDQGASQAILIAEVPNRRFSGDIEVALKQYVKDTTNWRKMLSGEPDPIDLIQMKDDLIKHIPNDFKKYIIKENNITSIKYPIYKYPKKIKSIKLEKVNRIEGVLNGIKGQYLMIDEDKVFNMRSHEGYIIDFTVQENDKQQKIF
ncbi:MAG: hypothetical protein CMP51_03485 [Flavobacteriales bacterium]|nr:hypothetical protein [Flavobacteriales bacterium]